MNKTEIKNYAIWAREELINRVTRKAYYYGVSKDNIVDANVNSLNGELLTKEEIEQRKKLIDKVKHDGFNQVIEEVAYTWFNRFIALRYMEVNNYLPFKTRVFTNENNEFKPQIMQEAMQLDISNLNKQKVYDYIEAKDDEGLYEYLLISICNDMGNYLPGMFTTISDYKVLLFPDNLLDQNNVIGKLIREIDEDSWNDQVTLLGWLYQFYNTEPKAKVYARKKGSKIEKEDIPAVTQLFTPDWICKYMVENSLGRLWLDGHSNNDLKSQWKYYLEEAKQDESVIKELDDIRLGRENQKVEDIKIIDPCMGSGHILVYAFDILMQIYESEGWTSRDAAISILENNLYGLDIDERAYQLSYFALMMKARSYNRKALTLNIKPNVFEIVESNNTYPDVLTGTTVNETAKKDFESLLVQMYDAKEYGSLLEVKNIDFNNLENEIKNHNLGIFEPMKDSEILPLVHCAKLLSIKYQTTVTNPPYTPISNCDEKLQEYVKTNYPDSKSDFCSIFIERCKELTEKNGYQAMITMHSWMFLSSFEKLREKILNNTTIINMAHLGARAFEEIGGEIVQTTAFVLNNSILNGYKGSYKRLVDFNNQQLKEEAYIADGNLYNVSSSNFSKIPVSPIAYWIGNKLLETFLSGDLVFNYSVSPSQNITGNNERFLRKHWELDKNDVDKVDKWIFYAKGGGFRKWWGNLHDVVEWTPKARKTYQFGDGKHASQIINRDYWYKKGITWGLITSNLPSFRVMPEGATFDKGGSTIIVEEDLYNYLLALLNSKVYLSIAKIFNPTLNFQVKDIRNLPLIVREKEMVDEIIKHNLLISKQDWDSFETSWDFTIHPLVKNNVSSIKEAYILWDKECNERFNQLKANEEELNKIFIDIYGLQDELTPEVEDKDVTVRKADLTRDIKSFISYAAGCMFGRYSLDEAGLVYAGGEFNSDKYKTFQVDKDNIIPICDDEYFDDDIVGRFVKFVEVVFGKDSLQENLKFIADSLGGKGTPKEVIRNYFLNDFYKDHCKIYQKRPIYWLFDSGKKNGFKALIYIHRYQPDLIARMRTDYVYETQSRYAHSIEMIEKQLNENITTSEKVKLNKELTKLKAQSEEVRSYEETVHHWADKMEPMDLDDGVKVNYEKFKDLLAKIK